MTDDLAQVIACNSGNVGGLYWNGMTFLVLVDSNPPEAAGYFQQYTGSGRYVNCKQETPVVIARSRLLHEYTHTGCSSLFVPVDEEFFNAYFKRDRDTDHVVERQVVINGEPVQALVTLDESDPNTEIIYHINGQKSNFIFHFTAQFAEDHRSYEQNYYGFNEYVTDYLSSQISIQNGLPYTLSYANPHSYDNFEYVLAQAGIDNSTLRNQYRDSKLELFLLKFADGAQNIAFSSYDEKLRFALQRIDPFYSWPFWYGDGENGDNYFTPYYPKVSTQHYTYIDPELYRKYQNNSEITLLGCLP